MFLGKVFRPLTSPQKKTMVNPKNASRDIIHPRSSRLHRAGGTFAMVEDGQKKRVWWIWCSWWLQIADDIHWLGGSGEAEEALRFPGGWSDVPKNRLLVVETPPECEVYSVSCGDIIELSAMMEMHVVHLFQYIVINWLLEELKVFTGLCYNASMKIIGNQCRTSKSSLQNVATGWIQGDNYTVSGFDLLKSSMITYFIIFPKQTHSTWVPELCHRSWGWILWRAWLWHWDPD